MNDEGVVLVLQTARDTVYKYLSMLELEQGYGPITGVYIANYKLLLDKMDDAIIYLGKDRSVNCTVCGDELTKNSKAYCAVCAPKADPASCTLCARELTSDNDIYCGDCHEHQ